MTDGELEGWRTLPSGAEALAQAGATPRDERAEEEFYRRTWVGPSLTVHSVGSGDPLTIKTSIGADGAGVDLVAGRTRPGRGSSATSLPGC